MTALRWLLPIVGGVGIACLVDLPGGAAASAVGSHQVTKQEANVLPDDPDVIKLAALAGRTSEARSKIAALLESGAKDEEIAPWLVSVLIADPGWLEKFIVTVPEQRRIDLLRTTMAQMAGLNRDSIWELVRVSPSAALAARSTGSDKRYKGLEILLQAKDSPLAAEVLFDPASGFTDEMIAGYFKWGAGEIGNSRRIIEEWIGGRWEGVPPDCVRYAWLSSERGDKAALDEIGKSLPESLKSAVEGFETFRKLQRVKGSIETDPAPEDLKLLAAGEVESLVEDRAMAAKPLPLELLAEVAPENRKAALETYFNWIYPFNVDLAHQSIARLKESNLTESEKDGLYQSASYEEWNSLGDLGKALEFASMISDEKKRNESRTEILEEFAKTDPEGALQHAQGMPEGELRARIEKIATESLP